MHFLLLLVYTPTLLDVPEVCRRFLGITIYIYIIADFSITIIINCR